MKKYEKLAAALVVMAAAIGMMGCAQPSGGGSGVTPVVYTATYQFTESVQALAAGTDGTAGTTATYVSFGDWPQSEAASDITFNAAPESNGYYVGSDGNYYAKVTVEKTKNEYTAGDVKYFKVEPIKWRVLDTAFDYDGESGSETAKLLLAENILTANVPFYESLSNHRNGKYPNNYEHSQIRAYLNGISYNSENSDADSENKWLSKGFLQTAFTAAAQAEIKTTVVNNKADSTKNYHKEGESDLTEATTYACDNTNDKIFLLSEYEVTKYSTEAYNASDNSRERMTTPYARANSALQNNETGHGYWRLRSPYYENSYSALVVNCGGSADRGTVGGPNPGVVPALSIAF